MDAVVLTYQLASSPSKLQLSARLIHLVVPGSGRQYVLIIDGIKLCIEQTYTNSGDMRRSTRLLHCRLQKGCQVFMRLRSDLAFVVLSVGCMALTPTLTLTLETPLSIQICMISNATITTTISYLFLFFFIKNLLLFLLSLASI